MTEDKQEIWRKEMRKGAKTQRVGQGRRGRKGKGGRKAGGGLGKSRRVDGRKGWRRNEEETTFTSDSGESGWQMGGKGERVVGIKRAILMRGCEEKNERNMTVQELDGRI